MSDRLIQTLIGSPIAELDEEIVADEVASTIRALGRQAENRPLPVGLDWSDVRVQFRPTLPNPTNLVITASARVK